MPKAYFCSAEVRHVGHVTDMALPRAGPASNRLRTACVCIVHASAYARRHVSHVAYRADAQVHSYVVSYGSLDTYVP